MLTKEQCKKALNDYELIKEFMEDLPSGLDGIELSCDSDELYDILNSLIEEHFDNPPLEFEELKEGMFVWDNKHHTYIKIDRIWESYNKTIYFYAIGWECCENTEYEPNRFYRKEVQE